MALHVTVLWLLIVFGVWRNLRGVRVARQAPSVDGPVGCMLASLSTE